MHEDNLKHLPAVHYKAFEEEVAKWDVNTLVSHPFLGYVCRIITLDNWLLWMALH